MQMPSLFKYFAFVGGALLALLSLANFLLEPSTGAIVVSQNQPAKPTVTVRHDPRASKIERWRNEQAALKSTVTETAPATTAAAKATWQAESAVPELAKPAPQAPAAPASVAATEAAEALAAPAMQTTDASANVADEAARAEQAKAEKIKAAKARKARLARERARAEQQQAAAQGGGQFYGGYNGGQFYGLQRNASNQQDQYYYGQRVQRERQSYNAYAPRQSFGPFGW